MGKITGFLEYSRVDHGQRPPEIRIKDWQEIRLPLEEETLKVQAARCMNCGVPFCQGGVLMRELTSGCPLHNLIPEWNDLVYKGQWEEAYRRLARTNPFPEFTGRVCPAPCEGSCTEGHILTPVTINDLEYEITERAFAAGWVMAKRTQATGKKIAVVGSGPAGLSAAYFLNSVGHDVTIYERDDRAGGLMTYGIPNMKLDKKVIERRIELMKASGILFILNKEIGKDITAHELIDRYDATLLCTGAGKARKLQVDGADLKGVHQAVEFLKANTKQLLIGNNVEPVEDYISARGKKVIVIGGGDTGTDCVATAIRQGCRSVYQFEIMPEAPQLRNEADNPWPEWPQQMKIDYGQVEAISLYGKDPRRYAISTVRMVGDEKGSVREVHTLRLKWEQDDSGRRTAHGIPGSERAWRADLVLLALGFQGPEDIIPEELKLERDSKSNVKAEFGVFKTNLEKVFVAGDMRRGQSLIVWAMQEGKLAAREIDRYLMGRSLII